MSFVPLLAHISQLLFKNKHFPEQILVPQYPPTAAESLTAWEITTCMSCSDTKAEIQGLQRPDCLWAAWDTLLPQKTTLLSNVF